MRRPILASIILLVVFLVIAIYQKNTEFMIYAGVLIPVIVLLHRTDRLFAYAEIALWGFVLWILLHVIGGLVSFQGVRMYDFMLLELIGEPYSVLRYDQFVHVYCYVVISMLLYSVVGSIVTENASKVTIAVVTILAASGVGALNEIIEFVPVVAFDSDGPGGYTNTAIDIVANFIGACLGTFLFGRLGLAGANSASS